MCSNHDIARDYEKWLARIEQLIVPRLILIIGRYIFNGLARTNESPELAKRQIYQTAYPVGRMKLKGNSYLPGLNVTLSAPSNRKATQYYCNTTPKHLSNHN